MINKTKLKTKLIATLVAIFMLVANIGLAVGELLKLKSFEKTIKAYSESVTLTNADFDSPKITSSTTLPTSPSSWTAIDKSEDVTAGVITLDTTIATSEKIENSYKLSSLPRNWTGMNDNQILMINAGTSRASAGYKSGSLTLSSGSHYMISFKAYTEANSNASAKLSGDELEKSENVLRIATNGMWKNYKIYVSTSSETAITTSLELWLGVDGENQSTGAVFFDNIQITKYDSSTFTTAIKNDYNTNANYKFINLDYEDLDFLANADFENELTNDDWQLVEESSLKNANETVHGRVNVENFNKDDAKIDDDIENTTVYGNRYALLINNLKNGYVGYKSAYFTIEQHALYKLSFLAKTGSLTGSATAKLVERNPYTNETLANGTANPNYYVGSTYEAQTFDMTNISTSDYTSSLTNGWKTYTFYIQGNNLIDTEMNLELWLGTESESAKGYVLFDNFKLQKITSNDYTTNSSNGTVANLNQNTTATDFTNGTFNLVNIDTVEATYPYAPQNWTLTQAKETANAKNGIINTSADNTALDIPVIPAINNKYTNNNVLMIGNISDNYQKYASSTVTISADTYAKITIDVLTTGLNIAK
ncbi:MAG: hypothetical protein J6T39_00575, partial [Clostridia bacterium]|nr:hypothetical protein [Clostridia bacterium]